MSCGSSWSAGRPGSTRPGPQIPQRHSPHGSGGQGENRELVLGGYPKMSDIPGGSHCEPTQAFSQPPPVYPRPPQNEVSGGYILGGGDAGPQQDYRRQPINPSQPAPSDMRLGPSQHSSTFYRNGTEEDQKSESPSRKRQRLVRSPVPGSGMHQAPGSHHHHHHMHHHHPNMSREQRTRPARHPPAYTPMPNRLPQHSAANINGLGNGVVGSPTRPRHYYSSRTNGAAPSNGSRHHNRGTAPPQYPRPSTSHQQPTPVAVAVDVSNTNLVPVTLSLPLYTNVAPPAPTLPPCQMPSIIWAGQASHVPAMEIFRGTRGFGDCPHHHHHHHHHSAGGGGGAGLPGGSTSHHNNGGGFLGESAVAAAVLRATPPLAAPAHFAPPPPPPPDSFELEIIVDHPYHRRAPMLQVSAPSSLAPSGILISEVAPRRPPPPRARWQRTLPPPPPPGLFHFLTMITSMNEAMSMYPQRDISHDNFQDNYEELLSLAERLGEAKPRGLSKAELDKLPSYPYELSTRTDQTSCVVCMCDFEMGHTLRKLHCCHMFHSKCVDKWLKANRTCPICRRDAAGNPPKVLLYNTD